MNISISVPMRVREWLFQDHNVREEGLPPTLIHKDQAGTRVYVKSDKAVLCLSDHGAIWWWDMEEKAAFYTTDLLIKNNKLGIIKTSEINGFQTSMAAAGATESTPTPYHLVLMLLHASMVMPAHK